MTSTQARKYSLTYACTLFMTFKKNAYTSQNSPRAITLMKIMGNEWKNRPDKLLPAAQVGVSCVLWWAFANGLIALSLTNGVVTCDNSRHTINNFNSKIYGIDSDSLTAGVSGARIADTVCVWVT